jgi:hypothetical protein
MEHSFQAVGIQPVYTWREVATARRTAEGYEAAALPGFRFLAVNVHCPHCPHKLCIVGSVVCTN